MRRIAYALLVGFFLAGCVGQQDKDSQDSGEPDAGSSPGSDQGTDSLGEPVPAMGAAFTADYTLDCQQVRFFLPIPLEHAQSLLPAGWQAADSGAATSLLQPGAPGVPTGQGLFLYDIAKCPGSTVNGSAASVDFANVAILVETPRLQGGPAFGAVNIEILDLELYSRADSAWADIFAATEWGSRLQNVTFELEFGSASDAGPGHAAIVVGGQPVASLDWVSTPTAEHGPFKARFWSTRGNGTVAGEIDLVTEQFGFGTAVSCQYAAGSSMAMAVGQTDCNGLAPLVITGLATNGRNGVITWMPGIFVEA